MFAVHALMGQVKILIQHRKLHLQPKRQLQSHLSEEKKNNSETRAAKDLSNTLLELSENYSVFLRRSRNQTLSSVFRYLRPTSANNDIITRGSISHLTM